MSEEATKHDSGKLACELLPVEALEAVADILRYGAQKYAPHNWRKGMQWSRMYGAALRHLFAWQRGETVDAESGLPHLAHASCCLLFLLTYERCAIGTDDRPERGK